MRAGWASVAVAVLLTAGGTASSTAQTREMTLGNVNPAKHGTTLAADQFVAKVGELTGGKLKIIHHHSGALGGEREVAQQIQLGTVDFGPITAAPMSTLVPELSALQLPYLFRDYQHVYAALDGNDTLRKYYDGVLDRKGFKLVAFIAAGYRGIYGHYPINSIADVKGKKIRVATYRPKKRHRRQMGHRSHLSRIEIRKITGPGKAGTRSGAGRAQSKADEKEAESDGT